MRDNLVKEIDEIVARNDRAEAVEATRRQMLDKDSVVTKEGYQKVYDIHRKALADEIKRVAALNATW